MKILAIETSTEACSAALSVDGEITERYQLAPRKHGELILSMAESLLQEAALTPSMLDAVAFGRGPGAFTGVRIATSVAQGIAYGADIALVPVSTLAVLARGGYRRSGVEHQLALIDARMGEVYWGAYRFDEAGGHELAPERVCRPQEAPELEGLNGSAVGWYGLGSGWQTYGEVLAERYATVTNTDAQALPMAADLAGLAVKAYDEGLVCAPEEGVPVYLRDNVAVKAKERA